MIDKKYPIEFKNTFIMLIVGVALSGFILVIPDSVPRVALAYFFLVSFSGMFLLSFKNLSKTATYKPGRKLSDKFYGFDDKPLKGSAIGILIGMLFIFLSSRSSLSILNLAIPLDLPFSLTANAFVVIFVAPIVETLFFTSILSVLNLYMNFWTSLTIRSLMFSGYHYVSYVVLSSSSISNVSGAFIGAFVFSMVAGYLASKFGAEADAGMHGFINAYNWNKIFGLLTILT